MSKKSKLQAREIRRKEKSGRKAANKAKYQSLAGTAANKKKKSTSEQGGGIKHAHLIANCGNIGCRRCHPEIRTKSISNPKSCLYLLNF